MSMIRTVRTALGACALLCAFAPLGALPLPEPEARYHWECVPFARAVSGIQIYGDAWTWWDQAEGHYKRGNRPRIGAVMAFIPYGRMELGHVATVSAIVDDRTILVTHANWSPIDDWTAVRVWYAPNEDLGSTAWPVHGFIYPSGGLPAPAIRQAPTPKLEYAAVLAWTAHLGEAKRPTGQIAYLGKVLPKLAKAQSARD
jgi:surface antigen